MDKAPTILIWLKEQKARDKLPQYSCQISPDIYEIISANLTISDVIFASVQEVNRYNNGRLVTQLRIRCVRDWGRAYKITFCS